MNIALSVIAILWILAIVVFFFVKKVPHGWVQFRTGLVLRFLPALDSAPVVQLRHSLDAYIEKKLPAIQKSLPVSHVSDVTVPTRHGDIGARIFEGSNPAGGPLMVLIHGGGWCIGSLNTYEEMSRRLVRATGLSLISLDYSLSPEHKFPQAHEECVDAVSWLVDHQDNIAKGSAGLALVGDSAGGNLIVATAYSCTDHVRAQIKKMVAIYPAVDGLKNDYPSNVDYGKGYYLTAKAMAQFTEGLVRTDEDLKDPRLTPLHNDSVMSYPDTFVITAQFDPLRDQSETFAAKLFREGHSVRLKRYEGTIHAFYGLKDFGSKGLEAIRDSASFILGQPVPDTRALEEGF